MRLRSKYDPIDTEMDSSETPKHARDHQLAMMKKAAMCAFRSDMSHRHGCIVVESSSQRIIATGYNHKSNHLFHTYSVHAEVDTLRKIKKATLSDPGYPALDMYVVRIGADSLGEPLRLSKPCKACTQAILQKAPNIRKVFYSVDTNTTSKTSFSQTAPLRAAS